MNAPDPPGPARAASNLIFVMGLLSGVLAAVIGHKLWPEAIDPDIAHYQEVRDFARESFVREVTNQELLDDALKGMLEGLDGYSRYYDRQEVEELTRVTEGRYKGIGAIFQTPIAAGQVLYPLPDSPASRAGVRVGDRILELGGKAIEEFGEAELRGALTDPDNSELRMIVLGLDDVERVLTVKPQFIVDPTVRHTRMLSGEEGMAYLAISRFSSETAGEFDRAINYLQENGLKSLIIDLRHNFGGTLKGAVDIARRFVSEGIIVSTEGRGQPVVYSAQAEQADLVALPLIVLVDAHTASASEVLAGALQDHRAAVLIGSPTFGKGMVQAIHAFPRAGGRAKVTTSYYYSPTHRNFERSADPSREHGLLPDLAVPLLANERQEVHAFLQGFSPSPESLPALEQWAADSGQDLIDELPMDLQLQSAIDLLNGVQPNGQRP